mmetsp:Transcript_56474/g.65989  ORF Transcript_56474/g.65989 Transcript_56474/m.65989 type:complete len:263 (-) Transcript_56474:458-1246(-)|eukprot:CAMPEP_0194357462 /NCGR_PEP_ID=MMETSP0174-20130528/4938_1 /TAXON_ID=216777 /ORGANISM="Proboscia alata, Strain PI-D3" /LENGTH=262 /DNA_ID=CAMNT_0039127491 /DNA_START=59 /DNA_END=847 /DNA_ORIENTATION=-
MVVSPITTLYCEACGMPPEYCEYGPDYESHCVPWLKLNAPEEYTRLEKLRIVKKSPGSGQTEGDGADSTASKPIEPWTTEKRLHEFYSKYAPDKIDGISAILEKYAGKEDKLFAALVKKYGNEPIDPFYADIDNDKDEDGEVEKMKNMSVSDKKKRRGAGAKKVNKVDTRIVIQKIARNRKKAVTIVVGLDTVPGLKLKEAAKDFSKRFAGSSSVKDTAQGKEIVIQGDHCDDCAAMIVSKYKVSADCVYFDKDGEFVPFAD